MNEMTTTILPIFAVPLGVVTVPEAEALNGELARLFVTGSDVCRSRQVNPLLRQGMDDLVASSDLYVQQVIAAMRRGILAVAAGINEFTQEQWNTFSVHSRAWFSVVGPNGAIAATHYPLAAWCAIYCIAAPDPASSRKDSGQLRLYESRLGTAFQDASTAAMKVPFRRGHYNWRPVAGRMAVFPASLMHEVALNRSDRSLVFLTMLTRVAAPGESRFTRW